jgi:signal transduction histidine kinase/ligand-binding sensor domain-containing protein
MKVSLLLLLATGAMLASNVRLSQWVMDGWNMDSGLPQNTITSITQTPDGYLWLATRAGIARFDGVRTTVFDRSRIPGLTTNIVTKLLSDGANGFWAAPLEPGLIHFDGQQWRRFGKQAGLPEREIAALHVGPEKRLWVAPYRGGLLELDGNGFRPLRTPQPLPSSTVLRVLIASDGTRWLATAEHGLIAWRGEEWRVYGVAEGLPSLAVWALIEPQPGRVLVGTSRGVVEVEQGKVSTPADLGALKEIPIENAVPAGHGAVWWLGYRNGVFRVGPYGIENLTAEQGLYDNEVRDLFQDREGAVWIATQSGLNRLAPPRVLTYSQREGMDVAQFGKITLRPDGGIVYGDKGGRLVSYRDGLIEEIAVHSQRLVDQDVLGSLPDGRILVRDGENKLFAVGQRSYKPFVTPVAEPITAFTRGTDERIWLGSRMGTLLEGTMNQLAVVKDFPLTRANITLVRQAPDGSLWVGTRNGLARRKNGVWQTWNRKNGMPSLLVSAMAISPQGTVWVGTAAGLLRFDGDRPVLFNQQNGLPEETVASIGFTGDGTMWLGTNGGIIQVDKATLAGAKLEAKVFRAREGLSRPESRPFVDAQPAPDGSLWISQLRAFARIVPELLQRNTVAPSTRIEAVLVDGKPLPDPQAIRIPSGASRLEFQFTALSLLRPERNQFRFRLTGYDRDWQDGGTRRNAVYTGLPGGDYRFEVMGSNGDGVVSVAPATISFRKDKAFHETVWFYLLVGVVIVGIAYGGYRLRLKQIRSRHALVLAERQRIARELHDGLLQEFQGATMKLAALRMEAGDTRVGAGMDRVLNGIEASLKQSREAIVALRSQHWDGVPLFAALSECAQGLAADSGVTIRCRAQGRAVEPSQEVKEVLWQTAREALRNSVKHSGAREIELELTSDRNGFQLSVRDNGCGFERSTLLQKAGNHFGLAGIRERAQTIGAEANIESTPGLGTTVLLKVPAKQEPSDASNAASS